jgi:predicted phage terminase large subunit-like protein
VGRLALLTGELARRRDRASAEVSFAEFVRQAWHIVEPSTPLLWNWHIDLLCEYLECLTYCDIRRLIINIPPRSMKSLLVTVMWPCWEWIVRPTRRYLFASYASSLSTDHSVLRRRIIESSWYQSNWPQIVLAHDQNLKTQYENTCSGTMISGSVGSTMLGKGGDVIDIDDPVNPSEVYSDADRASANEFMDRDLPSRLNNKAEGIIVMVMQRLHDDDPTGHVLKRDILHEWVHLCLPSIAVSDERIVFPRSGRVVNRRGGGFEVLPGGAIKCHGDLLWPEREGEKELSSLHVALGSRDFGAQYQQEPAPAEGAMFQTSWWQFYHEPPDPEQFDEIIQSWDMAFKDAKTSDFVVGQVWGLKGSEKYLLDQVRQRADFPATIRLVRLLSSKWPQALLKLVEDAANGPAVISELRREIAGIKAVTPKGSKEARAAAVTPTIEAGNVYLPDETIAPWVAEFVFECSRFPFGANDDQVDACTQALFRLTRTWTTESIRAYRGVV